MSTRVQRFCSVFHLLCGAQNTWLKVERLKKFCNFHNLFCWHWLPAQTPPLYYKWNNNINCNFLSGKYFFSSSDLIKTQHVEKCWGGRPFSLGLHEDVAPNKEIFHVLRVFLEQIYTPKKSFTDREIYSLLSDMMMLLMRGLTLINKLARAASSIQKLVFF